MPSRSTICHSGMTLWYSAASASVTVGAPLWQAVHFICSNALMFQSSLRSTFIMSSTYTLGTWIDPPASATRNWLEEGSNHTVNNWSALGKDASSSPFRASHSRTVESTLALARSRPSGENATDNISLCTVDVQPVWPPSMSQTRRISSRLPVAIHLSPGEKAIEFTWSPCLAKVRASSPAAVFQSSTEPSVPPAATIAPFEEQATAMTMLV